MIIAKRENSTAHGFTLSEMMISVVLAGVAMVTVWGILGTAQSSMAAATRKATQARIAKELFGEVLLSEWHEVVKFHNQDIYFDREGYRVEIGDSENGEEKSFWAYRANLEVLDKQAEIPGTTNNRENGNDDKGAPPAMSRRVVVRITNGAYLDYDFKENKRHAIFTSWVSKMDKR